MTIIATEPSDEVMQEDPLSSITSTTSDPLPEGGEMTIQHEDLDENNNDDAASVSRTPERFEDDDDDVTVIVLEHGRDNQNHPGWANLDTPEMEQRRHAILLQELQRVQRTSFIHFVILCTIPTVLLLLVLVSVLQDEGECESLVTTCEWEPRTFITAFTTRCICEAILLPKNDVREQFFGT